VQVVEGSWKLHEKWAKRLGVPKEVSRKVNEMSEIHRDACKTHRDHNVEQGRFTVSFQMLRRAVGISCGQGLCVQSDGELMPHLRTSKTSQWKPPSLDGGGRSYYRQSLTKVIYVETNGWEDVYEGEE